MKRNTSTITKMIHKDLISKTIMAILLILFTLGLAAFDLQAVEWRPDESGYPWVYLRGDQPLEPGEGIVELLVVGDIMLGRGVAGTEEVFSQISPWLRAADLAVGNFEGAIPSTDVTQEVVDPEYAPYQLLIPKQAPALLREAGFDIISLANNHSMDAGLPGLQETSSSLTEAGITPLGADTVSFIQQIRDVRIAFLGVNLVPAGQTSDMGSVLEEVQAARDEADVVVVYVHWGVEYQTEPVPAQMEQAKQLSRAGADLVIGHHPHVVQPVEVLPQEGTDRNTLVAYSLGNLVFDQHNERAQTGLALRVMVDQVGLQAVQALPLFAGLRPRLMEPQQGMEMLDRVMPAPEWVGFQCDQEYCQQVNVQRMKRSGIFWAGETDLTGDGLPESVKRTASGVTIYQGGKEAWHSPPEWEVLDLALGDPNDDGRTELLLALKKPNREGVLTSHPFIVGYRGGIYRLLWGGSAVSDPLLEVELADLDGDTVEELVVLEAYRGGPEQAVTVWRWHGWGFSQLWRSPLGQYEDLVVESGQDHEIQQISVAVRQTLMPDTH